MKSSRSLTTIQTTSTREIAGKLFCSLAPLEALSVKQIELSAQLAALMVYSGKSRTELAGKLGWKKSRLSHLFSGRGNPTVRTLSELANSLEHDFDVVFRAPHDSRPLQPWERTSTIEVAAEPPSHNYRVIVQTAEQVARDLLGGKGKPLYVTLDRAYDFTSDDSCPTVAYTQELAALSKVDPEPFPVFDQALTYIDV